MTLGIVLAKSRVMRIQFKTTEQLSIELATLCFELITRHGGVRIIRAVLAAVQECVDETIIERQERERINPYPLAS